MVIGDDMSMKIHMYVYIKYLSRLFCCGIILWGWQRSQLWKFWDVVSVLSTSEGTLTDHLCQTILWIN